MKNRHPAGSGQGAKSDLSLIATDRQRLLQLPLIRPHLIPVGRDKRPLGSCWQRPEQRHCDGILMAAPAIGLRLGYPVLAVDFDPKLADLGQAERTFQQLTGYSSAQLPLSWTVTSGKPGRRQVLLQADPNAAPWLKPWSHDGLEIRWRGQQSVIDGHHPETGRYQWLPGRAPWECSIAAAPLWLLEAIKPVAPKPAPYKPRPLPSCLDRWSPADWCRYYLRHWPASGLDARSEWWPTVVVMRRAGLTFEEAFAWTAASNKFNGGREFRRQWDKADRCSAPYGLEWLGARTRSARQRQGVKRG
ncbi:MAG: bifunctional DNA primase/polymerase [Synechococcaceae cyanobacterium]|nr:bifunctional DNA primase/polymerase [Synechococcaceae cyanobacterium]